LIATSPGAVSAAETVVANRMLQKATPAAVVIFIKFPPFAVSLRNCDKKATGQTCQWQEQIRKIE
jgi:hypothetical protein